MTVCRGGEAESEAVSCWVVGAGFALGSRITGLVMPRAVLSWPVLVQQKVSSEQQPLQATLGHSAWLQATEGLSRTVYEHTQQYLEPGIPVCPAQAIL